MKPIELNVSDWPVILHKLQEEYPKSVTMIRENMKRKLGFIPRTHRHWDEGTGQYRQKVVLDFYDERKRTMFLLKYSDILHRSSNDVDGFLV